MITNVNTENESWYFYSTIQYHFRSYYFRKTSCKYLNFIVVKNIVVYTCNIIAKTVSFSVNACAFRSRNFSFFCHRRNRPLKLIRDYSFILRDYETVYNILKEASRLVSGRSATNKSRYSTHGRRNYVSRKVKVAVESAI